MNEIDILQQQYGELVQQLQLTEQTLDYSLLDKHIGVLEQLSVIGNSCISVFDFYRNKHVFTSANYGTIFGYDMEAVREHGSSYFDSRIHPDDFLMLVKNGITMMAYYQTIPVPYRKDFKLLNEYRIQNPQGQYIRIIEQHQMLELDNNGNMWLALSVMDLAPNQDKTGTCKSQIINFKNGEILLLKELESKREKQLLSDRELSILGLIKDGLLSKEISEILSISVHTVNTHRQRILEKLKASNTMEAINYAQRLGLLS